MYSQASVSGVRCPTSAHITQPTTATACGRCPRSGEFWIATGAQKLATMLAQILANARARHGEECVSSDDERTISQGQHDARSIQNEASEPAVISATHGTTSVTTNQASESGDAAKSESSVAPRRGGMNASGAQPLRSDSSEAGTIHATQVHEYGMPPKLSRSASGHYNESDLRSVAYARMRRGTLSQLPSDRPRCTHEVSLS